jgi:hypothetical protein
MAAAVDAAEERKALDAIITAVKKELIGATGDKEVALQQRLTGLEQQETVADAAAVRRDWLGTQPGCWPPSGPPFIFGTHVLQIASFLSKASAERSAR